MERAEVWIERHWVVTPLLTAALVGVITLVIGSPYPEIWFGVWAVLGVVVSWARYGPRSLGAGGPRRSDP